AISLLRDARNEARLDRKLRGGKGQRLARDLIVDAVDLEQDAAGLDADHPQFRRTLARAHADFGRLLRHRNVGEYADPDAADTLHVARERTTGSLDLARSDALRRHRLQAELAERQRRARRGDAVNPALMRLAELCLLWLHHGLRPQT